MTAPDPTVPDVTVPDVSVEARGVLCPVPIIRLARAASSLPVGSVIELRTDDPAAVHDVPAWCRLRGHALLLTEPIADDLPGPPGDVPSRDPGGSEPHSPNEHPGQAVRHLIRLGVPPAAPVPPGSA